MVTINKLHGMSSMETQLASALPFWPGLTAEGRSFLLAGAELRTYATRESIHDAATDCRGLLLVTEGCIRSYISSEGGKEVTLFLTPAGSACLSQGDNGRAGVLQNIQATESCSLIYVGYKAFKKLADESLPVSRYMSGLLSSQMDSVLRSMESQLFSSAEQRIASLLLYHSELGATDTLRLTHSEIALHLGTAREVVSRTLEALSRGGALDIGRSKITILDRASLEALV